MADVQLHIDSRPPSRRGRWDSLNRRTNHGQTHSQSKVTPRQPDLPDQCRDPRIGVVPSRAARDYSAQRSSRRWHGLRQPTTKLRQIRFDVGPMPTPHSIDPTCAHAEALVERMCPGESSGVDELHRLLRRGLLFLAARKLPASQVDGCVREVFDRVVRGIQRGDLRNPVRLVHFARVHLTTYILEIQDKLVAGSHAAALPACPA